MDVETLALAKKFTKTSIQQLGNVLNFKGVKATVAELPTSGNKVGDVWAVSEDNSEYVWTTSNQWEKLGSAVGTLKPMKSEWKVSTLTTAQAATAILNDTSVIEGDGYLGTVFWSDLPLPSGTGHQAEVKAFVLKKAGSTKIIQFECTSGTVAPYAWFFNSYEGVWRSYVPINDTLTSTSTVEALSANQGKVLKESINNMTTYKAMKSSWTGSNLTTAQAASAILSDSEVRNGDAFIGGVAWSDLNTIGLGNGEATAIVGGNKTFVIFTMSSSNVSPYEWTYNSYASTWRSFVPNPPLSTNGTFTLQAVVYNGRVTYNWIAQ